MERFWQGKELVTPEFLPVFLDWEKSAERKAIVERWGEEIAHGLDDLAFEFSQEMVERHVRGLSTGEVGPPWLERRRAFLGRWPLDPTTPAELEQLVSRVATSRGRESLTAVGADTRKWHSPIDKVSQV